MRTSLTHIIVTGQPPIFFDLNRKFFSRLSLFVNEQTAMCARFSLGGVIECCRAVAEGKLQNAFAIVRWAPRVASAAMS